VVGEGENLFAHLRAGEMHWVLREQPLLVMVVVVVVVKLIEFTTCLRIAKVRSWRCLRSARQQVT
jgi:hypothetical protein